MLKNILSEVREGRITNSSQNGIKTVLKRYQWVILIGLDGC